MKKAILKHVLMFLAIFSFFAIYEFSVFFFVLACVSILSYAIGIQNLEENETFASYMWQSVRAAIYSLGLLNILFMLVAIVLFGSEYLLVTSETITNTNAVEWTDSVIFVILKWIFVGPAILNSYRAYRDWRFPAVEEEKAKKEKRESRLVENLDEQEWEIPEILAMQEHN